MARQEFNELLKGMSISQLGKMFDLDRRTVSDRLKECKPSGSRSSHSIYKVSEVAEYLLQSYMGEGKVSEIGKRQRADREKDYWDAMLKKQKFEENSGDLWRTEKVVSIFADVFKTFRESIVMYLDTLEHESGLEGEVIDKAKGVTDGLLVEIRNKLLVMEIDEDEDEYEDEDFDHDDDEDFDHDDDDFLSIG